MTFKPEITRVIDGVSTKEGTKYINFKDGEYKIPDDDPEAAAKIAYIKKHSGFGVYIFEDSIPKPEPTEAEKALIEKHTRGRGRPPKEV
jgi:hypothetical protein